MLALEVHINGTKQCTAGFAGGGVVSALLSCAFRLHDRPELPKEHGFLNVTGLDSERNEHYAWLEDHELKEGDEVRLRIINAPVVDAPLAESRRPRDEQRRKASVLRMAKEFGWKVEIPE
jgi:hypothetical protein